MRATGVVHLPRKVLHAIRQSGQLRGGLVPALCAAIAMLRREGVSGLYSRLVRADANDYQAWIQQYDLIDDSVREGLAKAVGALRDAPLISVIVPVYNTPETYLRAMINSVLAQIYPHWELCIADDASTEPHVPVVLQEYAQRDARIKVVRRHDNGHICRASNDALALASGRFVALLDHDDVLPEHALAMVAMYLERYPSARMLYSDEDKLAPNGQRMEPYFKSDWNPALALGQNMFSHLGVFEADLVRQAGGFRPGFEGSQDHDLVLRCVDIAGHEAVVHVPHVLYHWRITASSTSRAVASKPYTRDAALRAVREHLERRGLPGKVELLYPDSTMLRVTYAVPSPAPLVSIIIPTRDKPELLARCIDTLRGRTQYQHYEVLIVDNGSADSRALSLLAQYAKDPNISVVRIDAPFNYSALNNEAAKRARGSILCLLNNDIEIVSPDWLDTLVGYAALPDSGAVGAALWYPGDRLQHGGVLMGLGDLAGHMHHMLLRGQRGYFCRAVLAQQVSAVSAACLVVRKSLYDEVGGLDAEHLAIAFNDVDFCLKLGAAGYRNLYVPYADLYHHESASRGSDATAAKATRFKREVDWMRGRWGSEVSKDPFYNPNLALDNGPAFSLAFPPRIEQFS